jgi:hypothetical protein
VWTDDVPDDPELRAAGFRYLLRFLAAGIRICVELDDPEQPQLGASIESRMSWGLDNPDCNYTYTRVRGDTDYRIVGERGSACELEFQVNTGHQGDGDFAGWRAVSVLSAHDLLTDPSGRFELTLSPRRHDGNWMPLDDSASFLLVRQYFDDWAGEEPARLAIERIGGPSSPPPLSAERMADHVELLGQWLDVGSRCWDAISRGLLAGEPGDVQPFLPPDEASGLKGQAYGMGPFACGRDEAVILELTPPACRMWSLSLCDRFWQSIDFADRQSSLNSSQATLTDDGRFIGVITHDDPGLANWLDPGGHQQGTLAVRYLRPESVPVVRYRTVPRDELDPTLPPEVPRVSVDERAAAVRRRRVGVARRSGR